MYVALVVGGVFLAVSLLGLLVQTATLRGLLRSSNQPPPGLVRTSALRVGVAVLYVSLGGLSITRPDIGQVPGLTVFVVTQSVWMLAGRADLRLTSPRGRHRRA